MGYYALYSVSAMATNTSTELPRAQNYSWLKNAMATNSATEPAHAQNYKISIAIG
jgi:hypothetical protein